MLPQLVSLHLYFPENGFQQSRTDDFARMNGNDGRPPIKMLEERMAATGSHYLEPDPLKNA